MSQFVTGALNPSSNNETLHYAIGESLLGDFIVATSPHGLCWVALGEENSTLIANLQQQFTTATLV
jgi:AraC family transcriptional regulator, regulatory protein of adaptative response / methylated-DNA-[protein]-cysteine methyltransferase